MKIQKKNKISLFSGIPYYRKTNCKLFLKLDDYMNVAQTKIRDFSKYENHGTVYGAIPSTTEPTGFYFDGSDDYIDCGSDESLNVTGIGFTTWFNFKSLKNWNGITSRGTWGTPQPWILGGGDSSELYIAIEATEGSIEKYWNFTPTAEQWYHLAFTYDSINGLKGYVNGSLKVTDSAKGKIDYTNVSDLLIGKVGGDVLYGFVALLRIFKTLNENQIKNQFNNERNIFGV